jgi:hypothetical protein
MGTETADQRSLAEAARHQYWLDMYSWQSWVNVGAEPHVHSPGPQKLLLFDEAVYLLFRSSHGVTAGTGVTGPTRMPLPVL